MPRATIRFHPGEEVAIKIRGKNGTIYGPWSDLLALTTATDTTPPEAPRNPALEAGYRSLYISWDNPTSTRDLAFCFVYIDTSPIAVDGDGRVNIPSLSGNARIHAVDADVIYLTSLDPGTTHYCRIETVDRAGNRSAATGQVSGTTTDSPWDDWYLRLDCANDPLTGDLDLGGHRLANVSSPVGAQDAATKGYVDGLIAAISLDDLDNVNVPAPSDGQVLTWDSGTSQWGGDANFTWDKAGFDCLIKGTNQPSLNVQATGDTWPWVYVERASGSTFASRKWGLVLSSDGALLYQDCTAGKNRFAIGTDGTFYVCDNWAGSNDEALAFVQNPTANIASIYGYKSGSGTAPMLRLGSNSVATSHGLGSNDVLVAQKLEVDGDAYFDNGVYAASGYYVGTTKVVGTQQPHIADADGTLADLTTKFNTLLQRLENHGLLASS